VRVSAAATWRRRRGLAAAAPVRVSDAARVLGRRSLVPPPWPGRGRARARVRRRELLERRRVDLDGVLHPEAVHVEDAQARAAGEEHGGVDAAEREGEAL